MVKGETLRWPSQNKIANMLQCQYFDFAHHNKKNPLDELIFILLSVTTTEAVYLQTYRSFKNRFPCHADLLEASIQEIAKPIYLGGNLLKKQQPSNPSLEYSTIVLADQPYRRCTKCQMRNVRNSSPHCHELEEK